MAFGPPDVLPTPLSRSPEDTADSSKCHTAGGVAKVMPDNNLIEQDHRSVKQRIAVMLGFKQFRERCFVSIGNKCAITFPRLHDIITTCAEQPSPLGILEAA